MPFRDKMCKFYSIVAAVTRDGGCAPCVLTEALSLEPLHHYLDTCYHFKHFPKGRIGWMSIRNWLSLIFN